MSRLPVPRLRRLLSVARYERKIHMSGRPALRMLAVAAALLLPAGVIPTPRIRPPVVPPISAPPPDDPSFVGPPPPPKIPAYGEVPASLSERFISAERAQIEFQGENPVIVRAIDLPTETRAALETLDGPVGLEHRNYVLPVRLPGRSLLIAILAISLLTGPLADALPGERARRTLEVLLTTGITRGELIGGKWFAWTMSASLTAAVAAALAIWRGVQEPGWWLFGLPLFIGSAVAFGLWLVRLVDDVVGGSAAPMRVLPVAAGAMAALSRAISGTSPLAAAAIPLGGPLLLAADLYTTPAEVAAASVSTAVFITAILAKTGRDLDRVDTHSSPTRWGAAGLTGVATLLWWLTVAGPGVWGGGIGGVSTDLITPTSHSMMVGGIALLACALIAIIREPSRGVRENDTPAVRHRVPPVVVIGLVGAILAASGPVPKLDLSPVYSSADLMLGRLREAAVPTAMYTSVAIAACAVVSVFGQVVLFRSVVASRLGWITAAVLWSVAMSPWAPWTTLAGSLALGALGATYGWTAAFLAQLLWSIGASSGLGTEGPASLAVQMIALVIASAVARFARGEPSRHQL